MSLPRLFYIVFLFDKFSLTSTIFINIDGYDSKGFLTYLTREEELCLRINLVPVLYTRAISS